MSMLQTGRRALFLTGVLGLATAAELAVFAQQPAPQGQNLEEIVVTGSRIARRDFSSQSPIVTVDKDAFQNRSSIGLEATLDQLPQFNMTGAGSAAQTSAASTPFPQANAAPGAATVNLRGLGLNRNLVLIAGVVNFVLKKNFEGVQVNAQSGISEQGDGNESTVNGLLGASFADGRGSVMIGADYTKRDVIMSKDRDWVVRGWNDPGTTGGGLGSSNL